MFGGGKKNKARSNDPKRSKNDMSMMFGMGGASDDDDDDEDSLLAELAALEGKPAPSKKGKPEKKLMSMDAINKMTADALRDVSEDDDDDDDDIDESELLAELEAFSDAEDNEEEVSAPAPAKETVKPKQDASKGVDNSMMQLLEDRKAMYVTAIQEAKAESSTAKARRYERGLKEIDGMLKKAAKGAAISEDEIPPPVVIKKSKPSNTQTLPGTPLSQTTTPTPPIQPIASVHEEPPKPAPRPPQEKPELPRPVARPQTVVQETSVDTDKVNALLNKQKQFKVFALKMKQEGKMEDARKFLAISKQFDGAIQAVKDGKDFDISSIPDLPPLKAESNVPASSESEGIADGNKEEEAKQESSVPVVEVNEPVVAEGVPTPRTLMEGLEQRLAKYQEAIDKAKEEGNSSKMRRMGRMANLYKDAIKATKAGRPFDYNELPCPFGYPPLPGLNAPQAGVAPSSVTTPVPTQQIAPQPTQQQQQPATASRNEKEHNFLLNRQKEFKMAALEAKRNGDMDTAREYLRQAKGMDQMIEAARNGLRVEITTVPSLKRKSASMKRSGSSSEDIGIMKEAVQMTGSEAEQYVQIETALRTQVQTAEKNYQHYKLLGNLDAAKNFEALLRSSKKDLEILLHYKKQRAPVPKCNYVTKSFPVVRSNPHLSDSELEIIIVRCTNVPLPSGWSAKDMYVYVTYEFAYPQEKPQTGHTTTKKETINPEYEESSKVNIDRKNRTFARFCKRQTCNFKVYHVRGFLKSDKALGQANIKLEHFSNKCELHESLDLMDLDKGRKSVGGKIEVKLKIREPLVDKDAEIVTEKWLHLDTHLRNLEMKTQHHGTVQKPVPAQSAAKSPATSQPYSSLEVLKYEKESLTKLAQRYQSQGKSVPTELSKKLKSTSDRLVATHGQMKQGGKASVLEYYKNLQAGLEAEKIKAQHAVQNQDQETAKECLIRRKLIEKEIGFWKQKLNL